MEKKMRYAIILAAAAIGATAWWLVVADSQASSAPSSAVENPIGLVLAGGGAKGAYEVGVWKALCEAGLDKRITVISGTSIGAINAALFAAVGDPAACETMWRERVPRAFALNGNKIVEEIDKIKTDYEESKSGTETAESAFFRMLQGIGNATFGASNAVGVCDSKRLRAEISAGLPDNWRSYPPVAYVTALAKEAGVAKTFRLNEMKHERMIDCVMASAALPGAFDSVTIDGVVYVDGGFEQRGGDNVPLKPILANHPEVKDVIVVYLHSADKIPGHVTAPTGINLIEIIPSEDIDGKWFGGVKGLIDFKPDTTEKLLKLGYDDARNAIKLNKPE